MTSRNDVKLALLFISIGLIIGGIAGMLQTPPPSAGDGWTNEDFPRESISLIIPDQDGDKINDVLVWVSYRTYSQESGEIDREWNNTCGLMILSGKNGTVLKENILKGEKLYTNTWGEINLILTKNNSILLMAASWKTSIGNISDLSFLNMNSWELLKISLTDLKIVKRVNLTAAGWEDEAQILDQSQDGIRDYRPAFDYLGYNTLTVPGTGGYNQDVLVHQLSTSHRLDDGSGYNHSKREIHFINPETLELLSNITYDQCLMNGSHEVGGGRPQFCSGPNTELQYGWKYPYLALYTYPAIENPQTLDFSMTSIDKLNNNTKSITWLINNETMTAFNGLSDGIGFNIEYTLAFDNMNQAKGLVISQSWIKGIKNLYDTSKIDRKTFQNFADNETWRSAACRVIAFHFNGTSIQKSFLYERYNTDVFKAGVGGIVNGEEDFGIVKKVIPIKPHLYDKDETSVALICERINVDLRGYGDSFYPVSNVSVFFLNASTAGVNMPSEVYGLRNGSATALYEMPMVSSIDFVRYFNPIDFKLDNNNETDLLLPGLWFNQQSMGSSQETIVNGPYMALQQANGEYQYQYYRMDSLEQFFPRSDVNKDLAGDCLINNRITVITKTTGDPAKSAFEQRMADSSTAAFLIIGIVMIIAGIILLIYLLRMKDAGLKMKARDTKTLLIFIAVAILLVALLYILLGVIVSAAQSGSYTQIGITPQYYAIQQINQIAGWATFAFLTLLPCTVGIYILLTPTVADGIVGLNQIMYAKKSGLKAVKEKHEMQEMDKLDIDYRITIIPPFYKKLTTGEKFSRVMSVLALSVSVGLLFFNYTSRILFPEVEDIEFINGITDVNFIVYLNALFLGLIIPGLIAVPLFFWLVPTNWLLEDVGVLYYVRDKDLRKPEDVESVGGWFSSYLQGFLGISAIFSYIQFIYYSPITGSYANFGDLGITIFLFVFGFILLAGFAVGFLIVAFYELSLTYLATRLIDKLGKRKVDVIEKKIQFIDVGPITPERITDGYTKDAPSEAKIEPKSEPKNDSIMFKPPEEPKN